MPEEGSSSSPSTKEDRISFKDGNIRLLIRTQSFLLHQHKLEEFLALKRRIEEAHRNNDRPFTGDKAPGILELRLDEDPDDFHNILEILYLPVYKANSPEDHSDLVLKSALRLATKLQHRALRSYAIQCLEGRNMTPIERISIARESDIPSWKKEGLDELYARDKSITLAEAEVLGMKTFTELVARREARISKRKPKTPPPVPQDQPRKDSPRRQPSAPRTPRRSPRTNTGNHRVEPYPSRRVSSR